MFPAAGLWQTSKAAMFFITIRRAQLQPRPAGWKPTVTGHNNEGLSWDRPHSFLMPSFTSQCEVYPWTKARVEEISALSTPCNCWQDGYEHLQLEELMSIILPVLYQWIVSPAMNAGSCFSTLFTGMEYARFVFILAILIEKNSISQKKFSSRTGTQSCLYFRKIIKVAKFVIA